MLLLVAVQVLAQWRDGWFSLDERFIGPDAYMRTVRVLELVEGGGWYDGTIERSNAPYGEQLHWTRPLDALILAGAAPLRILAGLDWQSSVYISGTLVSPVLHILALLAFLWALRPLLDDRALVLAGVLFAAQFYLAFQFAIGRPDHHGLILLLDIVILGLALRLIGPDPEPRDALAAGLSAALVVWVSIEGLLVVALLLAVLAADWVRRGAAVAWLGWIATAAFCLGLVLALALERPTDALGVVSQDRLSVLQLAIAGLAVLMWTLALFWPDAAERPAIRGAILLAVATAAGGLLAAYGQRPGLAELLAGPMSEIHPRVIVEWWRFNREVSPLLDPRDLAGTLPKFVAHLGMAAVALPAMAVLAWQGKPGRRLGWCILLLAAVAVMALAVREVRWSGLAQVLLLPGYAAAAAWLIDRLSATSLRLPARALVPIVFAVGFLILGAVLRRAEADAPATAPDCDLKAMSQGLNARYGDQPRRIASFIFYGPELLYRTPHAVMATPYHRNDAGMLDLIDFFRATDMNEARSLAGRRGIDLIVVCPTNTEADKYRHDSQTPTLFSRLETGNGPDWIGPGQPLPAGAGRALVYEVSP